MEKEIKGEISNQYSLLTELDQGLRALTAMLNTHGQGTVYLGYQGLGASYDLSEREYRITKIKEHLKEKVDPKVYAKFDNITDEEGKLVIRIEANGSDQPYAYDGRYFVRKESGDVRASNAELRQMLLSPDADLLRQKASLRQDLSFRSFLEILSGVGINPKNEIEFYGQYGLLNANGELNINALLMSDQNNYVIRLTTFSGQDKSEVLHRTEFSRKCLLLEISEILEYFYSINTRRVDPSTPQMNDKALFDFKCFREALINACLHNDWKDGIPPYINIFADRIEVISYGGLPYGISLDEFYKGTSVPVNKSLMKIFLCSKYTDQSRNGVPTIVSTYGDEAFSISEGMVKVTIPFAFMVNSDFGIKDLSISRPELSRNQVQLINYLRSNPNSTLKDASLGIGLSLGGVKKICLRLQEMGILVRNGSKRNGNWIVKLR